MPDRVRTYHFVVTIGTTGTTIQSLIGSTIQVGNCRILTVQAHPSNAAVIYGGGINSTISTTNFGWVLPIPSTVTGPAAPFPIEDSSPVVSPAEVRLLSTSTTDKAVLFMVTQ